jgi:ribosomal protein S24E
METRKDFTNELLKRRELELVFKEGENPGFEKVKKEIVGKFKASEDVVVVKKVASSFGKDEFVVDVFIYKDAEAKNSIEPKTKEKKKKEGQ